MQCLVDVDGDEVGGALLIKSLSGCFAGPPVRG
jgi:hypothetical protein